MTQKNYIQSYIIIQNNEIVLNGTSIFKIEPTDFVDFSIYVDAPVDQLKSWYINRFLKFREGAFTDPDSYFHNYAQLSKEEAINVATSLWNEINLKNLNENILPTRERASLILTKSANHSVEQVRLRK